MTELGGRLREIQVPDSEQAMRVAARVIALEVAGPRESWLKRWRRWIVSFFAGALIAFAFTQPGRAITGDLGRIVGIGDEPTEDLPFGPGARQAVIGTGNAPNGVAYEVVASTEVPTAGDSQLRETCVRLDLLEVREFHELNCVTDSLARWLAARQLSVRATLASESLGAQGLIVKGTASAEVARVAIVQTSGDGTTQTYPAEVYSLASPVIGEISAPAPVNYVVAFLPSKLVPPRKPSTRTVPLPGDNAPPLVAPPRQAPPAVRDALRSLTAVAYDESGAVIRRQSLDVPNAEISLYPPVYPTKNVPDPATNK